MNAEIVPKEKKKEKEKRSQNIRNVMLENQEKSENIMKIDSQKSCKFDYQPEDAQGDHFWCL